MDESSRIINRISRIEMSIRQQLIELRAVLKGRRARKLKSLLTPAIESLSQSKPRAHSLSSANDNREFTAR
jgi:hypothetical protein